MSAFNARVVHAASLGVEIAIIGVPLVMAISNGRYALAAALFVLPLAWRMLYAGSLIVVSRLMFETPEATPIFSAAWFRFVAFGGVAIVRNQVGMAFPPLFDEIAGDGTGPILALIPGYGCNAGCFGTLPKRLATRGFNCTVFEPKTPIGDLNANAREAAAWLQDIAGRTTGRPIVLVGVSMGGVIARLVTVHPDAPRVAHLITVSSPHSGTWMARFGAGAASRQMRLDSPVLRELRTKPLACPATAIWTPDDGIILPPASGKLAGAETIAVGGYTHLAIVEAPAVEAAIIAAASKVRRSSVLSSAALT